MVWWPVSKEEWRTAIDMQLAMRRGWTYEEWYNYTNKNLEHYLTPYENPATPL